MKQLICLILIFGVALSGCSTKKDLKYDISFNDILGYDNINQNHKAIEEDIMIVFDKESVSKFFEENFAMRELNAEEPSEDEALLFLQFKGELTTVTPYTIRDIYVSKKKLIVEVKEEKGSFIGVSPTEGIVEANGYFSYVFLLKILRKDIGEVTEAELKIIE